MAKTTFTQKENHEENEGVRWLKVDSNQLFPIEQTEKKQKNGTGRPAYA